MGGGGGGGGGGRQGRERKTWGSKGGKVKVYRQGVKSMHGAGWGSRKGDKGMR